MALHLRFVHAPGQSLGFAAEHLADKMFVDVATNKLKEGRPKDATPMAEGAEIFAGLYAADLLNTPWPDGPYFVTVHHLKEDMRVVGHIDIVMRDGEQVGPSPPLDLLKGLPKKWNLTADGS